jgi:recombination protein RecR
LIAAFSRLPGVGPKSAERFSYFLLRSGGEIAEELRGSIQSALQSTTVCRQCFNLDEQDPCSICADPERDQGVILVVEDPRDVTAFEESGFRGLYHVLQGRVSDLEGVGPEDLTIGPLLERLARLEPAEVCLATSPDLEGEGTAQILAERLAERGLAISRIARGIPAGSSITQVSKSILADALEGRRKLS